jgi:hypothetical protein
MNGWMDGQGGREGILGKKERENKEKRKRKKKGGGGY